MERQSDTYSGFSDISYYVEISEIRIRDMRNSKLRCRKFEWVIPVIEVLKSAIEWKKFKLAISKNEWCQKLYLEISLIRINDHPN